MTNIVEFPNDVGSMLTTLLEMYREGKFRELIVYMPDSQDRNVHYYHASGGIDATDLLRAKQVITIDANKLWALE